MPLAEPPSDPTVVDDRARCQARPLAGRRGFRADPLCASIANATVDFRGGAVPVCRIHLKLYRRWGAKAESQAQRLWAWPAAEPQRAQIS